MHVIHVHMTPAVNAGSEISLRLALEGLRDSPVRSSLVCAERIKPETLAGVDAVVAAPEIFSEEPASSLRVRALTRQLDSTIARLGGDLVHVHLGLRGGILDRIARQWPVVYSAHVPICPNGARHLHTEREPCNAPIGLNCLTIGYRRHGCGHLADGTPVSIPAFARALRNSRALLPALARCAAVVVPSHWQARRLAADGLPSERIRVIHPPVQACQAIAPDHPPVVAFAGRLVPFKGADHLLRASREIAAPHSLRIVGDGPQRRGLEDLASTLGIATHTHFHGAVSPEEARRLLGHASVVAVPSLCGETFNLVGAQAAAGGVPVVAYDVGGVRDWAGKYPHAVLVPPTDYAAFVAALGDRLVPANTRAPTLDYFSPARHVSALVAVYREATTGSTHSGVTSRGSRSTPALKAAR